jgi:hypothetical protein
MEYHNLVEEAMVYYLQNTSVIKGIRWAYFDNQCTTISISDFPITLGSASIKSIDTSSHIVFEISRQSSNPIGCRCSVLFF